MRVGAQGRADGMGWTWARLEGLSGRDVFDSLRLRQDVFVLEQTCLYPDIDDLDLSAWHLLGRSGDGALVASLRVVDPGTRYPEPSIGRVVVERALRGDGLGHVLMRRAMEHTVALYPRTDIRISAQTHLEAFYGGYGFRRVGEPYLEDGIPHIEMLCLEPSADSR